MSTATDGSGSGTSEGLFRTLLVLLALLPWPHGGEQSWEHLPISAAIFLLLAIVLCNASLKVAVTLAAFRLPFTLLALWLAYTLLQALVLPRGLVETISPQAAALRAQSFIPLSIAPGDTMLALLRNSSYVALLLLCLVMLDSSRRLVQLAGALFASSALMALYSLANHYSRGAYALLQPIPPWTIGWDLATRGSFSYQNHYAAFLNLTIPLGIALALGPIRSRWPHGVPVSFTALVGALPIWSVLLLLLSAVMVVALFGTASRGGSLVFVASMVLLTPLLLRRKLAPAGKSLRTWLLAVVGGCMLALIAGVAVPSRLADRFYDAGFDSNGRDDLRTTAFKVIAAYPLSGAGAGTYPLLQHQYKVPELGTSEMSKRAHNDYLELVADQGIFGASLPVAAILLMLWKGWRVSIAGGGVEQRELRLACLVGAAGLLVHSLIDFNFSLPALSCYFLALVAISLSCCPRQPAMA